MKILKSERGFTLAEMIVVVAIIATLAALVYSGYADSRVDARNRAVKASLQQTQLALELYKDVYGVYPAARDEGTGFCDGGGTGRRFALEAFCFTGPYIENLMPDFIDRLPTYKDSALSKVWPPVCQMKYMVANDKSWYKLIATNCHAGATSAANGGVRPDDPVALCPSTCRTDIEIYNAAFPAAVPLDGPHCGYTGAGPVLYDAAYTSTALFYNSYAVYSAGGECF